MKYEEFVHDKANALNMLAVQVEIFVDAGLGTSEFHDDVYKIAPREALIKIREALRKANALVDEARRGWNPEFADEVEAERAAKRARTTK